MFGQATKGTAYFAVALCLAALQLHPLTLLVLPVPVAVYWARGESRRSAALAGLAGLAGGLGTGSAVAVLMYLLAAWTGVVVGWGFRSHWGFGRCLAASTAAGFALCAGSLALQWDAVRQASRAWVAVQVQEVESYSGADSMAAEVLVQTIQWFSANWEHMVVGMLLGAVLLCMSAVITLSARWIRRHGTGSLPVGTLKDARPPEWLVWVAIVVAALWFAEQQWPNAGLRMLTWNTAVGLAWIYWLNGFCCLLFALAVFKTHPFVLTAALFVLITLNVHTIVATFGLFDTWWDFRRKLEKLAEARRLRERKEE